VGGWKTWFWTRIWPSRRMIGLVLGVDFDATLNHTRGY
jgi:hypothetical protein